MTTAHLIHAAMGDLRFDASNGTIQTADGRAVAHVNSMACPHWRELGDLFVAQFNAAAQPDQLDEPEPQGPVPDEPPWPPDHEEPPEPPPEEPEPDQEPEPMTRSRRRPPPK